MGDLILSSNSGVCINRDSDLPNSALTKIRGSNIEKVISKEMSWNLESFSKFNFIYKTMKHTESAVSRIKIGQCVQEISHANVSR